MSSFAGVTFSFHHLAPSDDAIFRRAAFPDCALSGCSLSYSGFSLTMSAGYLMICGRQIRVDAPVSWVMMERTGFARILLTIDMVWDGTVEISGDISAGIEYGAAIDSFPPLDQQDINNLGSRYQTVICTMLLSETGITAINDQIVTMEVET